MGSQAPVRLAGRTLKGTRRVCAFFHSQANDIVEYETKLNLVLPKHCDPVVCTYDLNKHSGSVVMDILRTHPLAIVGGVLQENPLYVPPAQFLAELQERKVH